MKNIETLVQGGLCALEISEKSSGEEEVGWKMYPTNLLRSP